MTSGDYYFQIWVGLNVRRLFVIYFVPLRDGANVEDIESMFQFTFGGARKVGYECNFEQASVGGHDIVAIWSTVNTGEDLLSSPQSKLFWAQDVAMMTESLLRTAHRHGVDLALKSISPRPL